MSWIVGFQMGMLDLTFAAAEGNTRSSGVSTGSTVVAKSRWWRAEGGHKLIQLLHSAEKIDLHARHDLTLS